MAARNFTSSEGEAPAEPLLQRGSVGASPSRVKRLTSSSMGRLHGRATRFALTLTACIILLLAAGALTVRYIFVDLPAEIATRATNHLADTARGIANDVVRTFQVRPRVTVGQHTIVEQQNSVLELVTLEKAVTKRRKLDNTWLQSTKTLEVECDLVVRAGFDLTQPFVIELKGDGSALSVSLPPARILGVDLRDVRFLRDEDGFWNKLTPADREAALRELRESVELEARNSDLPQSARELAEKRLSELLSMPGRTITFESAKK